MSLKDRLYYFCFELCKLVLNLPFMPVYCVWSIVRGIYYNLKRALGCDGSEETHWFWEWNWWREEEE